MTGVGFADGIRGERTDGGDTDAVGRVGNECRHGGRGLREKSGEELRQESGRAALNTLEFPDCYLIAKNGFIT